LAGEAKLDLMKQAGLARTPVAMDAKDLWQVGRRDGIADFLDQRATANLVVEGRFVVV